MLGVVRENFTLDNSYIGSDNYSWSFYLASGEKYTLGQGTYYTDPIQPGDNITITMDLK